MKAPVFPARPRSAWMRPLLVGAGSLFALLAALAWEGFWDVLSWALLALPLALVGRALMGRR